MEYLDLFGALVAGAGLVHAYRVATSNAGKERTVRLYTPGDCVSLRIGPDESPTQAFLRNRSQDPSIDCKVNE